MRSSLDIAFVDTIAEMNQCAESVRRFPDAGTRAKVVRTITTSVTDLFAEILCVGRVGEVGDTAVRLGPLIEGALDIASEDGVTYLAVDEDGTFREAQRGQTRAAVVEEIATGEYEAEQVFRLKGPICEDVTEAIAAEVLERLRRDEPGPVLFTGSNRPPFIPALLFERLPDEAEALRRSWMTPEQIRQERDEANAGRAYEAMRDRLMDAAE